MAVIAHVEGVLSAAPKPVICLDTCDILEVVQCLDWEKSGGNTPKAVSCIEPVRRLLNTLTANPNRAELIITDLVHTEWSQNIAGIRAKAKEFISKIDDIVARPYQAAGLSGTLLPIYPRLAGSTLVSDLVALSTELLNQATRLVLDDALIDLALARVMGKHRPSHDGHIKDSINFEHYLELARRLRAGGFTEEVIFVSKNRKDYWNGENPHIHPDLHPQINDPAVQLRFFGSVVAALGFLGI
jgi:PIN domain-containing protein